MEKVQYIIIVMYCMHTVCNMVYTHIHMYVAFKIIKCVYTYIYMYIYIYVYIYICIYL